MSTLDLARRGRGCLADIRQGKPLSARLSPGGAVYAVSGELWITQEGSYEDIVLAPGERFDVERRGLIVVSATRGTAVAYFSTVSPIAAAGAVPAEFHAVAAALRRSEVARLTRLARAALARWMSRFSRRVRGALT